MRGSEKLKNVLSTNNDAKSILFKCLILYNLILGFIYWHKSMSYVLFVFLTLFEIASTVLLYRVCRPSIINENGIEKLVHVESINAPGMAAFCWDTLFWSMMGKFLMVFSWKWFWVYLGIPISFFIEFIYKPYKKIKLS